MAFNKLLCGSDVKNTGVCDCYIDFKLVIGAILVPKRLTLTSTQLSDANVYDTFKALTLAAKASRIYPFMVFNGVTDNTEDPTSYTSGYGESEPVREGNYDMTFNFRKGGLSLSNALRSFNGLIGKYAVLFVDKDNTIIGTKGIDENGAVGLSGIPLTSLYTNPFRVANGNDPAIYGTRFAFKPEYINENVAFAKYPTSVIMLSDLTGLETIMLSLVSASVNPGSTSTYTVAGALDCGSDDLFDLYGDDFNKTAAWVGDSALAPTGVVKNTGSKAWTLTFSTDVDLINLAAPSVLAASPVNVEGYEGIALDLQQS